MRKMTVQEIKACERIFKKNGERYSKNWWKQYTISYVSQCPWTICVVYDIKYNCFVSAVARTNLNEDTYDINLGCRIALNRLAGELIEKYDLED